MQCFIRGSTATCFSSPLSSLSPPAQMQTPISSKGKWEVLQCVFARTLSVHQQGVHMVCFWAWCVCSSVCGCVYLLSLSGVCMCVWVFLRACLCIHTKKEEKKEGWRVLCSIKGTESPGDGALSVCACCVCVCVCFVCVSAGSSTIFRHSARPRDSGASHQRHSSIIHLCVHVCVCRCVCVYLCVRKQSSV